MFFPPKMYGQTINVPYLTEHASTELQYTSQTCTYKTEPGDQRTTLGNSWNGPFIPSCRCSTPFRHSRLCRRSQSWTQVNCVCFQKQKNKNIFSNWFFESILTRESAWMFRRPYFPSARRNFSDIANCVSEVHIMQLLFRMVSKNVSMVQGSRNKYSICF